MSDDLIDRDRVGRPIRYRMQDPCEFCGTAVRLETETDRHFPRPDRIELAEDEFLLHVTDPVVPAWKVGEFGETRYEGRTVPTVITQVWADGWFKLRRVEEK